MSEQPAQILLIFVLVAYGAAGVCHTICQRVSQPKYHK